MGRVRIWFPLLKQSDIMCPERQRSRHARKKRRIHCPHRGKLIGQANKRFSVGARVLSWSEHKKHLLGLVGGLPVQCRPSLFVNAHSPANNNVTFEYTRWGDLEN